MWRTIQKIPIPVSLRSPFGVLWDLMCSIEIYCFVCSCHSWPTFKWKSVQSGWLCHQEVLNKCFWVHISVFLFLDLSHLFFWLLHWTSSPLILASLYFAITHKRWINRWSFLIFICSIYNPQESSSVWPLNTMYSWTSVTAYFSGRQGYLEDNAPFLYRQRFTVEKYWSEKFKVLSFRPPRSLQIILREVEKSKAYLSALVDGSWCHFPVVTHALALCPNGAQSASLSAYLSHINVAPWRLCTDVTFPPEHTPSDGLSEKICLSMADFSLGNKWLPAPFEGSWTKEGSVIRFPDNIVKTFKEKKNVLIWLTI